MNKLKIAVPDGSMEKRILDLFESAGMAIKIENERQKIGTVNCPMIESITFMRPQEIPIYLEKGYFDMAIVGEDWLTNWQSSAKILTRLPVARKTLQPVRVVLVVEESSGCMSIETLKKNARIATEYVELARSIVAERGRNDIEIIRSYGGTERKVKFGADAVIDITETGESLVANKLKIIEELMQSYTVIVLRNDLSENADKRMLAIKIASKLEEAFWSDASGRIA
jgi:ATP phosphoribosyltransferase